MESSQQSERTDGIRQVEPSETKASKISPNAMTSKPVESVSRGSHPHQSRPEAQTSGSYTVQSRRKRSFDDANPVLSATSGVNDDDAARPVEADRPAATEPSPSSPSQQDASDSSPAVGGSNLRVPESGIASRPNLQHHQHSSSTTRSSQPSFRGSSVSSSRGSSPRSAVASSSGSQSRSRLAAALDKLTEEDKEGSTPSAKSNAEGHRFELIMRQQPGKGAAVGLSATTFNRLPVVPTPVAQLRVYSREGQELSPTEVLNDFPYLICNCNLVDVPPPELTEKDIDFVRLLSAPQGAGHDSPLPMLCGTRAYTCSQATHLDGAAGLFFSCWDVSVRQMGEYRLRLTLIEALPGSTPLAKTTSEPFRVVDRRQFPGDTIVNTPLGRDLQRQGVSVYIPPLGLGASE